MLTRSSLFMVQYTTHMFSLAETTCVNFGFPQQMAYFVDCVANDKQPLVTVEDGRAVLEAIFAAYASSGQGRKIDTPFESDASKPIDLWNRN